MPIQVPLGKHPLEYRSELSDRIKISIDLHANVVRSEEVLGHCVILQSFKGDVTFQVVHVSSFEVLQEIFGWILRYLGVPVFYFLLFLNFCLSVGIRIQDIVFMVFHFRGLLDSFALLMR